MLRTHSRRLSLLRRWPSFRRVVSRDDRCLLTVLSLSEKVDRLLIHAYRDFHIVTFARESSLLSIESRIWVIPTLVEEAIIWEAERVRLVVLRVLRHGTGTDDRWGLQATGQWNK